MRAGLDEGSGIACVVADDHPAVLDSVERVLTDAGHSAVARVSDGKAALAAVGRCRPQILVTDVRMPRLDGLEVASRARSVSPETAVVVYSGFADPRLCSAALKAGARAIVSKRAPLDELVRAVESAAAGEVYIDPALAASLVADSLAPAPDELQEQQREVLQRLADGDSYVEIATALHVSPDTVRGYAHEAKRRLGARTRTHAIATALRQAIIK